MSNAFFVGAYVDAYAKVLTASLLSGTHVISISGPGTGKTAIMESVAKEIAPNDWTMVRCDPSTPPESIKGAVDVKKYLETGEFAPNAAGTPFDGAMRIVIMDEASRASEIIQHLNIQLLDRARGKDVYQYPVVWNTANYIKVQNALEALYDRIAFWFHVPGEDVDVLDFVKAQVAGRQNGGLHVRYQLPTWEQIQAVRDAQYSDKAVETVARFMNLVVTELAAAKLNVNRRRLEQWQRILLACSAYEFGSGDFTKLSPLALDVFQHAWAAPKPEDQVKFKDIVAACSDPTQFALEHAYASVAQVMNELAALDDIDERRIQQPRAGVAISQAQMELQDAGLNELEIRAFSLKAAKWLSDAINEGKSVEDE